VLNKKRGTVKKQTEYLIIGGGIAGSLLTWHLLNAGKEALLVDHPERCSATRVAGGMINPITGKRLVLSWRMADWTRYNTQFYPALEKALGISFYSPLIIRRIFKNAAQANDWLIRQNDPAYRPFIEEHAAALPEYIHAPHGAAAIRHGAGIQSVKLLDGLYRYFGERLIRAKVDYADIHIATDHVDVAGIRCARVVFCEGWHGMYNPWFRYLPFHPSKGDALTLDGEMDLKEALAFGVFLLPQGGGYRCGSTYIWDDLTCRALPETVRFLTEQVQRFVKVPLRLTAHKAGVRPTVKHRRPFLGRHPREKRLWIFNGLGTKGLSLAPLLAESLMRYMTQDAPLDPETDIARFG